ncbi:g9099 [Coccomyxa viridis]|uniref:G9099 protein n=1 Tax=Coccomyxa viridis TaxID=1274662 RepID=A0ABP1G6T3_9CHLO
MDVILSKCDAREQLLITGLSRNLREKPVRALILNALEMSRTWPAMTSRELQWTIIVRHVDLEPVDVKWRLEDRRSGDIVAVRADCRLPALMSFDPGMPPHCRTLEEFWTQTLTARKKAIDLDKIDEQALAPPRLSDPELELEALFGPLDAPAAEFEPLLFAHEQLDQPAEVDVLFQDVLPDMQPLDGPETDVEPQPHDGDLSAHEQLMTPMRPKLQGSVCSAMTIHSESTRRTSTGKGNMNGAVRIA